MAKAFGIGTKIIVLVLSISIISVAVTTGLAFNLIDSILKSHVEKTLKDESSERGDAIAAIIESRINSLNSLANNDVINQSVLELSLSFDEVTFQTILNEKYDLISEEVRLFQQNEFEAGLNDLKIINLRGTTLYSSNDDIDVPSSSKLKLEKPRVEFFQDESKKRLMKLFVPIKSDSGSQLGSIVAVTPTSVFDNILLSRYNLQETGEVYLVNKDGKMISESIFVEDAQFNQRVNTLPVSMCFDNNESVTGEVYLDYRDVNIFGISYCQKDLGFVLLTEVDEAVIQQPIYDLQEKTILVGLSIMIVAAALSFILSKRLSKPILKLRDATRQIARGNFIETKIQRNDEIGELSSSFDTMTRTIKETISAISRRENLLKQQEKILLKFSESRQDCCICLIDMVGAKKITSKLSKDQEARYNEVFVNNVIPVIKQHNGISVKMVDDAILFYFKADDEKVFSDVINCCLELCELSKKLNDQLSSESLPGIAYRISSTFGTVNLTKSAPEIHDVFGEPVNNCFKINQYALPNSLVIDTSLYEKVKNENFKFTHLDKSIVEGLAYDLFIVNRK